MRCVRRIAYALPFCLAAVLALAAEPAKSTAAVDSASKEQSRPAEPPAPRPEQGTDTAAASSDETLGILLTIILRQDQSRPQTATKQELRRQGFFDSFPPPGTEVVSWYVVMGIGQIVTLRVPPQKLPEVNTAIEKGAWGAFHTEFYPTYDYREAAKGEYSSLK